MQINRLLGYSDFFPNRAPKSKEEYAIKVGKEQLSKLCCLLLAKFKFNQIPPVEELLPEWFTMVGLSYTENPDFHRAMEAYTQIHGLENQNPSILNVQSLLNLFIWLQNTPEIPAQGTADKNSRLFPALELILLFNDDVLSDYEKAATSIRGINDEKQMARVAVGIQFSQADFYNINSGQLMVSQFYKLDKLLTFLQDNPDYHRLLGKLLEDFNCGSTDDFILRLGSVIFSSVNKNKNFTTVDIKQGPDFESACAFFEKLAIPDLAPIGDGQDDYLMIRNKPFQTIEKGSYRVIFEPFLFKKAYTGIIFKFLEYLKGDKTLFPRDFLGSIRAEFSEGVLLYDVMPNVVPGEGIIRITGDEFKAAGLEREPDYYTRKAKCAVLIESKDFFMPGKIKLSYDFKLIEAELKKDGRLMKAVKQLAKNVGRALSKKLPNDTDYDENELQIFPIITLHDSLYNCPGLNYWVNFWFRDEIEELKKDPEYINVNFSNTQSVTLVDIDTLILYQPHFENQDIDFIDLLSQFQSTVRYEDNSARTEEQWAMTLPSFADFVTNEFEKRNIKLNFQPILEKFVARGLEK